MQDYQHRSRQNYSNYDDVLSNGRKSYNFANMQKSIQLSQTDKRIQQIKRKYDTPNRRQRVSQLSVRKSQISNKQNQNYGTADFKTKIPIVITQTQGSEPGLKQSKAISNSRQNFFNGPSSGSKSFLAGGINRQRQNVDYRLPSNKIYTNQNEEQFFKRVKQMKQSLLYGENSKKETQMKGSTFYPTKQSRSRSGFYDSNQTIQKDRIDNIDKINQKIKGILQCLNENEKTRIPSRYDAQKKSQLENPSTYNQQSSFNNRQIARTPMKNIVSSSIMGRQSFGNHRHQRSEILDKIEINRDFKDYQNSKKQVKQVNKQDDKWQKLSSKLQKYELDNKLRIQKAFDFAKQTSKEVSETQNIVDNIRQQRYGVIANNDAKKSIQMVRRQNKSMDLRDLRSRSFLNNNPTSGIKDLRDRSLHTRQLTEAKQYPTKSGKKLDDQIDKIQKKIQQFEQQKKRLNINFTPFNYSNTKSTSNLGLNNVKNDYSQRKISDFNKNINKNQSNSYAYTKQLYKDQADRLKEEQTFRQKKDFTDKDNSFNRLDSKIQIKLQKSNPSSVRTSKFISQGSSRVSNDRQEEDSFAIQPRKQIQTQQLTQKGERQFKYFFDESLKKQTDDGIQQRKKKLMNFAQSKSPVNTQLKIFVKNLCEQVKLDQDFRNAKIWFEYNNDSIKQDEVKKLIPQKNLEQIRQIMKVRESENNPFFTTQGYESSYKKLADLYHNSQSHWKQNLYKKFEFLSLQTQGFTNRQIDLEKKGHISLGDLVRFLNLQSGTFYRNRDLSLVFIRICKQYNSTSFTQVNFQWLKSTFCV